MVTGWAGAAAEKLAVPMPRLALGELRCRSPGGNTPVRLQSLPGRGARRFTQTKQQFCSFSISLL